MVWLHVDNNNFVCEGNWVTGKLGNGNKAGKGPHIFQTGPT